MGPKVVLDPADFNYIDRNNEKKKSVPQRSKSHQDLFFPCTYLKCTFCKAALKQYVL